MRQDLEGGKMTLSGILHVCGYDKSEGFTPCSCKNFKAVQITMEETAMAKEKKAVRKMKPVKSEGRKSTLAPFVDGPFKIYGTGASKDVTAQVLSSGIIVLNEKEYTSPSTAAQAVTKVSTDGYRFWQYNKDGERVTLDEIRGSKSPLKVVEVKPKKSPKAKAAKKVKAKKPRPSKVLDDVATQEQ